jgi:hypothetical protein
MPQPELSYNIAEMRLSGNIDGTIFDTLAYCGGRGGSKIPGAANPIIMNNPFLTSLKEDKEKKIDGGPLPIGIYTLSLHEKKTNWIRLTPKDVVAMHGRDGFAIHGRGPEGSQGCIVPEDFSVVQKICALVKDRKDKKKSSITIDVYAQGDLDYYLSKLRMG